MTTHDMPGGTLGAVRLANNMKDVASISGSLISCGLDMEQSGLRNSRETDGKDDRTNEERTQNASILTMPTDCVPMVTSVDAITKELNDLSIGNLEDSHCSTPNSETSSLVERQWSCEKHSSKDDRRCKFKFDSLAIMSFNCLARSLVDNKYLDNDRDVMSWNIRKFAILDVLRHSNADVVCLQEVDEEEYNNFFLGEFERLGYGAIFKKKKSPKLDGVCVLYKEDRFDLLYHKDVEFAVHDAHYDRLQVAVVVALIDKATKLVDDDKAEVRDIYIVANTHLLFNKNRGDVKFAQLCAMLSAIKDMENLAIESLGDTASTNPKPAIIMCGDFNFTPQSLLYHFLSQGYVVLRNCDVKLMSGQYLMFDTTYKTEQAGHAKSGITVGDFEGNYISEIYGTADCSEWLESLSRTTRTDFFTKMPDWMKNDGSVRRLIANYLHAVSEHESGQPAIDNQKCEGTDDKELGSIANDLLFCPFKFTSAYSVFDPGLNRCNEPAFTAFHGWQRGCVDYIWYTREELDVESIYELPAYRDVTENGNLPNKGWPSSDHFSLVSQFKRHSA
ncbi:Protein angel -like protein 2 [Babesia sp. Xinjiang]|uniref:Protein angel -like protein 2 n=1 Tax=Babesia sp. Xinjiang TaxID=462227 RepID=UPI000A21F607|nr:Protein angel -like protein 2 [Babesia sp. Xinjiang]XP_028871615.1 Protein angel -like protein 2 [Babesia sp. Xinjiang]ORM41100.1 Protein angel -like protein 2 [Babesia sp. Xinjiang]ORM41159.1 Protein angel -like protein 2 [Babesia sp. Xinjiang]